MGMKAKSISQPTGSRIKQVISETLTLKVSLRTWNILSCFLLCPFSFFVLFSVLFLSLSSFFLCPLSVSVLFLSFCLYLCPLSLFVSIKKAVAHFIFFHIYKQFLVACTRLYEPLSRSKSPSVKLCFLGSGPKGPMSCRTQG